MNFKQCSPAKLNSHPDHHPQEPRPIYLANKSPTQSLLNKLDELQATLFINKVDITAFSHRERTQNHKQEPKKKQKWVHRPVRQSSLDSFGKLITTQSWQEVQYTPYATFKTTAFYSTLTSVCNDHVPVLTVNMHTTDRTWTTADIREPDHSSSKGI